MVDTAESRLTLTQLFEQHYFKEELRPTSLVCIRVHLRHWERLTGSMPVGQVTNETVAGFRQALIDANYAPATIHSVWTSIRAVFRRIGPPVTGNPWGLGIIDRVPAMRPVKQPHKLPKRVSLDELNTLYLAAWRMSLPKVGVVPATFWQCALTLLYTTGLRIGDLMSIKWEDVDLQERTLFVRISKTGVEAELPLHGVAIAHLQRMPRINDYVICRRDKRRFHDLWREWKTLAGTTFYPHDVRRTACSEVDRVARGMGAVLMLHAPQTVTQRSYLNALPELREAVEKMEIPLAMKHGVKMAQRSADTQRRQRIGMNAEKFALPEKSIPAEFEFIDGGFAFAGRLFRLSGQTRRLLEVLVHAEEPVSYVDLFHEMYPTRIRRRGRTVSRRQVMQRRVVSRVNYLRSRLREMLGLPQDWNPVQSISSRQWDEESRYVLVLPPTLQTHVNPQ